MNTETNIPHPMDETQNALALKLKEIGFEKPQFEPIVLNRFIVKMDDIPSYVVCSVNMPTVTFMRNRERKTATPTWDALHLHLYNPTNLDLEKKLLEVAKKDDVPIEICYLGSVGDVVTKWNFKTEVVSIEYGQFAWKNDGDPNLISLVLKIKEATVE